MVMDNDTIIIIPDKNEEDQKPRKEYNKSNILKNVRMDIEELNELRGRELRKDTRSDIFLGESIDKNQKKEIYRSGKVYVRAHTKHINGKCIVVKPYLRNK